MRTYQSYQREDVEQFGNPWDDEPQPVKGDATEKQINFLVKLMDERNLPWTQATLDKLSKKDASALISTLLDTPKPKVSKKVTGPKTTATGPSEITEGMYRNPETEEIFKVQRAVHGSGHLYAKILLPGDEFGESAQFAYAAGAIRKLRPEWKLSLEDAKAWGALYGSCCCCGRTLTDEKSIADGIGPICAGKYFSDNDNLIDWAVLGAD
jgi:hypothetical protein